jgi:hypothetical protein
MSKSAFESLIVPVFWGTVRGILAGMALLMLWNAVVVVVGRLGRMARSLDGLRRSPRAALRRARTHPSALRRGWTLGGYG